MTCITTGRSIDSICAPFILNLNVISFKGVNRKKLSQLNIFSTILCIFLICFLLRQNVQNQWILRVDFSHYLNIFCQPTVLFTWAKVWNVGKGSLYVGSLISCLASIRYSTVALNFEGEKLSSCFFVDQLLLG